jgi:hypothetical protein
MNVLDENIVVSQRELLRSWKIHFRRIGGETGRLGMKDHEDIIPLLHTLQRPTFLTHDYGFYHPNLLHAGYCPVYLEVGADEIAKDIHRRLRHQAFRVRSQRMGKIIRVRHNDVSYWQMHERGE